MKKIFIFLGLMFVMLSSTYAQKGRQAIGFGLSYGTEIESAGLGIKYQYNITNPLRIEPSFNYFFVSIRPRACFSPSYNKVKSQTCFVWLLTLL